MPNTSPRRRILCIRPRLNPAAGPLLQTTSDEWIVALALHSEVFEIGEDFNLREMCDCFRPDLMVFDAVNWARPFPLAITDPYAHPAIPRVLYLNSDPHDPMRALTARMLDDLRIDTVFVTAEAYRQHFPELDHRPCYFAHQFFDETIYKDYHLPKSIPVSVFGGYLLPECYAWRARTLDAFRDTIPTLIYTHPGYTKGIVDPFAVRGEAYARLLNQSRFSGADTTRLDYLVRKHLEIPGSGAVLIAPESEALRAYGFVDLENCILGEGSDLSDKVVSVAADPAAYERIRSAGHALVHTRYNQTTWTFMLDWLECRLALAPGQMVRQAGHYGPFRAVAAAPGVASLDAPPRVDSEMTAALREARAAILSGRDLEGAEARMLEVAGWIGHVAEPFFMLGIMALLRGDVVRAAQAIARRAQSQAAIDASLEVFDPVETAWLMLVARLMGKPDLEQALRERAAPFNHVSLRRIRWFLEGAASTPDAVLAIGERRASDLLSVHWLGDEPFPVWCDLIGRVLKANGAAVVAAKDLPEAA